MDAILPFIYFIIGLIPGIIFFLVVSRRSEKSATSHHTELQKQYEAQIAAMQLNETNRIEAINATRQQELDTLKSQHAEQLEILKANQQRQLDTIKAEYEMSRQRQEQLAQKQAEDLRRENIAQFKALAAEMLASQTSGLKQANSEQLEALLKPLSENIDSFRKAVNDSYVQENASRKSLTDQIDRLMKLNESIGIDAKNLASALRGNSKVQGDWGEMILETMLENAGLEKGIHFTSQMTRNADGSLLRSEEGNLQRPDVVVNMPDARKIVIDSKVSLTAFVSLCNAEDESSRVLYAKKNLESVRHHIDELAVKKYPDSIKGSADHVLMFIPNEGAYIAALQADARLWQYAYDRGVAIVSPTHLFSVMKIISQLWVQDKQNRNTLEIARRGGKLYEKVVGFVVALQDVGTALKKASDNYDLAYSRLYTGKGNVVKMAQDLKDLGAKTAKSLPQDLIDKEAEENNLLS